MKKVFLFLAFVSLLNADIDIKDAWKQVLHVNEGLKASQNEVDEAKKYKEATKNLYLPEINLGGSYTRLESNIGLEDEIDLSSIGHSTIPFNVSVQDEDVFMSTLSVSWPIYTGGRIDAASDIYKAKEKEAEAKHHLEKDKIFLKFIKVYYGVVIGNELLKTRLEAQHALELHLENAKKLKEQGQIANIELLNAQVKLDSALIETTKAYQIHEITKLALADMLDSKELPNSHLFIDSNLDDEKQYKAKMLDNYAGLDVIKSKKAQVDSKVIIESAAYKPTFFAYGSYLLYKDDSPLMDMTPDWMAGIGVKFNILSRDGKSEKLAAAKIMKNRLVHTLNQAQSDLSLLVEKTYKEMLRYKTEYQALSSSLSLADENLRLRELAFKEGLATSVDVVDAQMFLTGSKTKRLNAIYNYVQKISQLAVLSGDNNLFFELENNSAVAQ